jgi:glycosyltransferase involved in cell wall biosynthesis
MPGSSSTERAVVLVAHEVHDRGGMERVTAELVRQLAPQRPIVVVSRVLDPALRPLVEWRRIRVPGRPFPLKYLAFWIAAALVLRRTQGVRHTVGAVVPNRVDVVAVHFLHAAYRPPPSARSTARRLNDTCTRALALLAEQWCYRPSRVSCLAAVSDGVAQECRAAFPRLPVVVTPNGVDVRRFRPDSAVRRRVRDAEGVDARSFVVIFVGGDWGRKGLQIAVDAVAEIDDAQLWVVGAGVRDQVTGADGGRVRFLGMRENVAELYAAADAFVLPSAYETFSLVAHEAAASGLPLLVTPVHGARELVERSGCGAVLPASPAAFAAALAALAADPAARQLAGEAGRAAVQGLDWDAAVARTAALWDAAPPATVGSPVQRGSNADGRQRAWLWGTASPFRSARRRPMQQP